MSFFHRNCPCCGEEINMLSIYSKKNYNSTNCKLNYKCFHCPKCRNKISRELPIYIDSITAIVIGLFCVFLAQISTEYFTFYPEQMRDFFWILFWLLYAFFLGFFITHFYAMATSLKCTKLTPNEYDNQPDSNILFKGKKGINLGEFDKDVRIDPLERKMFFHMAMLPTYVYLPIIIIVILFVIISAIL